MNQRHHADPQPQGCAALIQAFPEKTRLHEIRGKPRSKAASPGSIPGFFSLPAAFFGIPEPHSGSAADFSDAERLHFDAGADLSAAPKTRHGVLQTQNRPGKPRRAAGMLQHRASARHLPMKPLHWDAINPYTGRPFAYDDPNVRWGYYLEENDPGFTPYNSPANDPKPSKTRRMKHQPYYPTRAAEQIVWLGNFANKISTHAPGLGISTQACADAVADARWIIYVLGSWLPAVRTWQKSCTDAASAAQEGTNTAVPMTLPVFTAPTLPGAAGSFPAVVARPEGAVQRLFGLVADLKLAPGYDPAIGADLGVEGAQQSGPDYSILRPNLAARLIGTRVEIEWGWQGYGRFLDQCEIQVDRNDGQGWVILTFDTSPGYVDTTPHPANPTRWKYRAIYRVDDARVGLWSEEVSVIVGG